MTIRRGFNRLFIAAFVCWNLAKLLFVFKQARESSASAYEAAEAVRQTCIAFKKCPPSAAETEDAGANASDTTADPKTVRPEDIATPEQEACYASQGLVPQLFPRDINCEAAFTEAVSKQSLWHECKTRITDPKTILYIEGIPAGVYLLFWALTAAVLWIARGFGLAVSRQ
jgi:hypothetical protein